MKAIKNAVNCILSSILLLYIQFSHPPSL